MFRLLEAAISRSRTTLLLLFMILLSGLLARCSIPVEGDPDISVPFFVITVVHEGISPEDAERLLVMPLEVELRQVEGIEEINAYASENAGTVMVEFDPDDAESSVCKCGDRSSTGGSLHFTCSDFGLDFLELLLDPRKVLHDAGQAGHATQ